MIAIWHYLNYAQIMDFLSTPLLEKRLKRQYQYNALKTSNPRSILSYPSYCLFRGLLLSFFKITRLYKHCLREASHPEITDNIFVSPKIPKAFNGFKILHLSDLHIDTNPTIFTHVIGLIKDLQYDIAVFTGDYFEHSSKNFGDNMRQLKSLLASINKPTYGILGNHDYIELAPFLEHQGVKMLLNKTISISRKSKSIYLSGVDDPHYYGTHDLKQAHQLITPDNFSIVLSHSCEIFFQAEQLGFDCMLSGHSHGGQICLPGGIPIINNSRSPRYMISGPWCYKNLQGYTSRGVGSNVLPLRLFCKPEITIHTLVHTNGEQA